MGKQTKILKYPPVQVEPPEHASPATKKRYRQHNYEVRQKEMRATTEPGAAINGAMRWSQCPKHLASASLGGGSTVPLGSGADLAKVLVRDSGPQNGEQRELGGLQEQQA